LQKLEATTVGLDIYRDFPTPDKYLAQLLKKSKNLFAICKIRDTKRNHPGVAPPPEISAQRRSFSDGVEDGNGIVRRYLLGMVPEFISPSANYSIGVQVVFDYLAKKVCHQNSINRAISR
jgi:CHASE2 domain-containing sensor protein